ncbi:MAG TPA: type VII secretion protein EccB [Streptosporangiaceae bacterium]|nr:type VII secretion protein EccB [Streptosporangiaceae bacterium]
MLQTRKDLLQAHQLMTRRAALALLRAEPDPPDQPLRRLNVGAFSSLLVAAVVAAVFGIWGLVAPGDASGLTAPGTLLIDKETGTPYVPCGHGKLCPVVNYASARLVLGTASPNQREVTQTSLARYPQGPEVGIPGLPPLPSPSLLVGQPWSVCVHTSYSGLTQAGRTVTTLVGGERVGGRPVSAQDALLVSAAGHDWVIWDGERMLVPLPQQAAILTALDFNFVQRSPQPVPVSWLDAFSQQGHDFTPPPVTGFGAKVAHGPAGGPASIGQVFVTSPGGPQYYVLTRQGLLPVTETEARLLDAIPGQVSQGTVTTAQAATHHGQESADGMPLSMPHLADNTLSPGTPLCVVYSGPATTGPVDAQVTVGGRLPSGGITVTGGTYVNQIVMGPGSAALVGMVAGLPPRSASGVPSGQRPDITSYFLVTGGVRYGLSSAKVAAVLGYDLARQQTLVPASVVGLIPLGPAFDPSTASRRVSG